MQFGVEDRHDMAEREANGSSSCESSDMNAAGIWTLDTVRDTEQTNSRTEEQVSDTSELCVTLQYDQVGRPRPAE